jgi:hypothetical protein
LSQFTDDERRDLLKLCDEAVEAYLGKRGTAAYDHRRAALGYVSRSGTRPNPIPSFKDGA